jgi:hypothetical protein
MAIIQLPEPPSGFQFAKDGLGKVTSKLVPSISDSLKSASNSITSAGSKFFANLPKPPSFGADTNGPSLLDSMNAIKDGSINKDIAASLNNIGEVTGSLPPEAAAALEASKADVAAKMAKAQADLPKTMALAQANMDLTVKLSIASTGEPPTEDQLKEASGALTIFQEGPEMLKAQAESISKKVAEAGAAFGAPAPGGLDFAKAGLTKVTDLAKSAGAKITEFATGVPSETIPDPANPGQTIPNPAFLSFAADPENSKKLSGLASLTSALDSAAEGLNSAFGALEAKADAAVAGGIKDLKAFAFASQLAAPATGVMADAKNAATDLSKVSALQIAKTNQIAATLAPTTPPKNTTVDGRVEPKLPKDDSTSTTTPKTAVFGKNPRDKISESFLGVLDRYSDNMNKLYETIASTAERDFDLWYPGYAAQKNKAEDIKKNKPDVADRTAEETRLVEKREKLKAILKSDGMAYLTIIRGQEAAVKSVNIYNTVLELFKANKTYGDVPLSVEGEFNSIGESAKEPPKGFATFAEYKAANPGVDFSWDV